MTSPAVQFGDVNFQQVDADGVTWVCENLEGWADLPETTAALFNRAFDHGAFYGETFYTGRILTLDGAIAAPDQPSLQRALHALRGQHWRSLRVDTPLTVAESDGAKSLNIRASKPSLTVQYLSPLAVRVVIELAAAWPVKSGPAKLGVGGAHEAGAGREYPRGITHPFRSYGEAGSTGDLYLTNAGNAPVRPVIVFHGPVVNPQLLNPGQGRTLTFGITLAAGDRLMVDTDTHLVLLNDVGNRRYVLTNDSAWFDLLPGVNVLQFRSASNSGTVEVHYTDGWW